MLEDGRRPSAGHARNLGLGRATGEIIAYLDSDNAWLPDYLLIMLGSLSENASFDSAYCGETFVDSATGKAKHRLRPYDREALIQGEYIDLNVFVHRRAVYERLGGFDTNLLTLEDWELVLRYTKEADPLLVECVLTIYYIEKDLERLSQRDDVADHFGRIQKRYTA